MASFFKHRNQRQDKRKRQLEKLKRWREAKARKHQEAISTGWLPEPRFIRSYLYEYGIRNVVTGETHWRTLTSARQASKALGLIMKFI
jgi:hypothetical protein